MMNYYTGYNNLHQLILLNGEKPSLFSKKVFSVTETTAELCVAGTGTSASSARRTNLFTSNRIQPTYETHLPSIRDTKSLTPEKFNSYSRPKTPATNTSPRSTGRPPSASMSSIFNALAKRSTENMAETYEDYEEIINANPVPPSRRSQRPYKINAMKHTTLSQKQSGDSGIDIHFSSSSADANQQRVTTASSRLRTNGPQIHVEVPTAQETPTKERASFSPLYQRRQNHSVRTQTKQKIDKYRRRSGEVTQTMNGSAQTNRGSTPADAAPKTRPKPPPPSSPSAAVHRVASDGELQARFDVLRLSVNTNPNQMDQQKPSQSDQHPRHRIKSPYLYANHYQTKPRTPPVRLRRTHGTVQPASSVNSSQQPQAPANPTKESITPNAGNLYLAFIASRHFSSLEEALFECDIDHQKLLRIFTWLKGVEDHRHEQLNHEQLLIEQNQRMLEQEENLSLYSEIQHAVDDLPSNTTGKPCEKIATMQFE